MATMCTPRGPPVAIQSFQKLLAIRLDPLPLLVGARARQRLVLLSESAQYGVLHDTPCIIDVLLQGIAALVELQNRGRRCLPKRIVTSTCKSRIAETMHY